MMNFKLIGKALVFMCLSLLFCSCNSNDSIQLLSPDNNYHFSLTTEGKLSYSVNWNGSVIIDKSALGFKLANGTFIPGDVKITKVIKNSVDKTWRPVYGEFSSYTDKYNEVLVQFKGTNLAAENIALRVRAYNEGVAFRYEFNQPEELEVLSELTEFTFPNDPFVWVSLMAQSSIDKQKLSDVSKICDRPLLAELSDSVYAALGEANLVDFARMKFEKDSTVSNKLRASLSMEQDKKSNKAHFVSIPGNGYFSPWRFIMAGQSPSEILQNNYLLLNLSEPNKIEDTSWIKPGKVIREVTLTTKGGIACVDFAEKHNLQYVEFDAGWYGNEYDDASDATTVTVDPNRSPGPLDLKYVINYAKEKGIDVILYVNRRALEKQLDEVLPLLKSWGVAGVKYGFVNVGPQKWTTWLHDAVRKAAEHGLMVDIHDEYRPTGYSRTYPNLMTQEGIRGDEESAPNDMVINTLFTRMIAGAGDQTNCYFSERVSAKMGSHVSQMAKTICIYSPWQFLYWYDRPVGSPTKKGGAGNTEDVIPEIPDLAFFDQVPTVWDETKIIDGYPGEFAVVARKHEDKWYLGAITGTKEMLLNVDLKFLDEGKEYKATVFSHDESLKTVTKVKIQEIEVTGQSEFEYPVLKQNGLAVIFKPVK
ncbi:glycoside hydrolase family 97 protein [Mariniphaga sediminis]|uniref:glycoside hydrolase family 97 protein n=1 Tax=Mariniphaga sediminis TaxID=1628158 RepID=UPI003566EBAC